MTVELSYVKQLAASASMRFKLITKANCLFIYLVGKVEKLTQALTLKL